MGPVQPKGEGGEEDRGVNRWQVRMDAAREVAQQRRQEQRHQQRQQVLWRYEGEGTFV